MQQDKWHRLSLVQQLGNIGAEIGRTISWRKNPVLGNPKEAFYRCLELIDLSINDPHKTVEPVATNSVVSGKPSSIGILVLSSTIFPLGSPPIVNKAVNSLLLPDLKAVESRVRACNYHKE